MNTTTKRPTLAAVLAAGVLAVVPATAMAGDGGAKPMSSAETYALTCGHLGVPCNPPRHSSHRAKARHAHGARHHRRY